MTESSFDRLLLFSLKIDYNKGSFEQDYDYYDSILASRSQSAPNASDEVTMGSRREETSLVSTSFSKS